MTNARLVDCRAVQAKPLPFIPFVLQFPDQRSTSNPDSHTPVLFFGTEVSLTAAPESLFELIQSCSGKANLNWGKNVEGRR